ncbi:MAG TPA: sugar phosphate isomerase/epimerase family protein [Armatimonadota bacterium]|nr:sugar phosphate isomerase/epimerase family protein [Armatimonadota bacterium]
MRFGCCAGLSTFVPPTLDGQEDSLTAAHAAQCGKIPARMQVFADAGFDYIEFGVGITAPDHGSDAYERFLAAIDGQPLVAEVFSSFIPPWHKMVGPEVDWDGVEQYVATALERVARAGGERVVFGSGGARTRPDDWPRDEAWAQLARFVNLVGDYCDKHAVALCIEHLNATETNMITTVAEGTALAREVDRPSVRVLADCFHMGMEDEPYANIVAAGELLAHAHVADKGRRYPADFGYDIDGFFAALQEAGYDQRVSIEANFEDIETEAPAGLARMRQAAG